MGREEEEKGKKKRLFKYKSIVFGLLKMCKIVIIGDYGSMLRKEKIIRDFKVLERY